MFQATVARLRLRQYRAEVPDSLYSELDKKIAPSLVDANCIAEFRDKQYPKGLTWRQTYWRRGPLLGISALILAFGCIFAALAVLLVSDGQPIAKWESKPVSVYLSISVTACNALIRFGLANALPVLWWRHAMEGKMIEDLNREWEVGRSLLQALGSLRSSLLARDQDCSEDNRTCALWQTINGTRTDEVSVYRTNLTFWGLAALMQLLAIGLVAPIFWGWWRPGREVSFSPFEIAKAFDAPLLQAAYSNSKAGDIVSTVGLMPVRYGVVHRTDGNTTAVGATDMAAGRLASSDGHPDGGQQEDHGVGVEDMAAGRLAFTDGLEITRPCHQQRFAE